MFEPTARVNPDRCARMPHMMGLPRLASNPAWEEGKTQGGRFGPQFRPPLRITAPRLRTLDGDLYCRKIRSFTAATILGLRSL